MAGVIFEVNLVNGVTSNDLAGRRGMDPTPPRSTFGCSHCFQEVEVSSNNYGKELAERHTHEAMVMQRASVSPARPVLPSTHTTHRTPASRSNR